MLPLELVSIENEVPKTTSLVVADFFGRRHADVVNTINKLDCSSAFTERNYSFCTKNNVLKNGKPQNYCEMTKDGFMFLVMGFTGKKAARLKEAYIDEFNRMSDFISERQNGLMFRYNKLTLTYNNVDRNASHAGRELNYLGKIAKPELLKQLDDLEKQMQLRLNFGQEKADTLRQDEMSANLLIKGN